jgi:2-polyprenyl-6-hydroxyphenyl methylase/3-demethylubiquinone-9 3-methyltransferase
MSPAAGLPDLPNRERWQQAQAAELEWWQNWSRLPFYMNHSFSDYWRRVISGLMGDPEAIPPGVIVEVGCGPHGVVRYLFKNARFKLGIDPLLDKFEARPSPDARTGYAAAIGEMIPVKSESADIVFCINVLDHVMDAFKILDEIRRVLKPGGKLLLEVHTFPRIFTPIMFFDHPHTYHWTRAKIGAMVEKAGFKVLKTQVHRFPIELPISSFFKPSHWKYIFGKLFMQLSYVYCSK